MAKISIETHTNGTPNPREWHSRRDVTVHYRKLKYFGALNEKVHCYLMKLHKGYSTKVCFATALMQLIKEVPRLTFF